MNKLLLPLFALTALNAHANPVAVSVVKTTPVAIDIKSLTTDKGEIEAKTDSKIVPVPQAVTTVKTDTVTTTAKTTPTVVTTVPSVTTGKGEIEVKTDTKSVSVSKAPNAPTATTITKTSTSSEPITLNTKTQTVIYEIEEPEEQLSQADLDYINAVNVSERVNTIESKIINNKVITQEELKILRKHNPNY